MKSVFLGEELDLTKLEPGMSGVPQGVVRTASPGPPGGTAEAVHKSGASRTVILVFVFLAVFILYYFANWKVSP